MSIELRDRLFKEYARTQGAVSSPSLYHEADASWPYYIENYQHILAGCNASTRVLEIGCGPGNLLAWFVANGVSNVQGVEASRGDAELANERLGEQVVSIGTAIEFLEECNEKFDLIVLKAVMEHQPKDELVPLLEGMVGALAVDGRVVIDVPNMDWITAMHERYMDLTHEVGFTRESLAVLLQLWFDDVDIRGSRPGGIRRSHRIARGLVIRLVRAMLFALGEGASNTLFESRAIIAVARQPRE